MEAVLQFVLSGLAIGAIYAVVAQGIFITYAATRTFNFAQGEVLIFGAFIAVTVAVGGGQPFPVALAAGVVGTGILGVLTERIAISRLKSFDQHEWLVSTAGVSFILLNLMVLIWGRETKRFPSPFGEEVIRIGPAGILPHEVFVFVASLATVGLLLLFFDRTRTGRAFRAIAFNREAAELMGIDARGMAIFAYALSAALAGLAGGLIGPLTFVNAYMGLALLIKGFIAAIVGGIDNPAGILVAALLLGVAERALAYQISAWSEALLLVMVIIFLGLRPQGLFGRAAIEKV